MTGAEVVLFCVDARDGLTASDYDMADVVRRAQRPTIVVATKATTSGGSSSAWPKRLRWGSASRCRSAMRRRQRRRDA